MTENQASRRLSNAVLVHFKKWAKQQALVASKHRKRREITEYSQQHLDEYLKPLFQHWSEHAGERNEPVFRPGSRQRQKRLELALKAPRAHSVTVAGSFNDWDPAQAPLRKGKGGIWRRTLLLSPGRYVYRFIVDGAWRSDPNAKQSVANEYGEMNSVVEV